MITKEDASWLAAHFRLMESEDPTLFMPFTSYSKEQCQRFKDIFEKMRIGEACGLVRPNRQTMCQLPKGHSGSCQATVFWEGE